MKRQVQKTGVKGYFGDDLVELQTQPLAAIDAMLAASGECVVSGCQITPDGDKYNIAPGYVALETVDQTTGVMRIMAMPFDGATGVTLPIYLTDSCSIVERAYKDGAVKPIAYSYKAIATAVKPTDKTSIEVTAAYTRRLADALAEALAKYVVVTATEKAVWNAKETPAGAQTKADAAKTAAITAAASDATTKANAAKSEAKSEAIAEAKTYTDANKYTHPADANTRHVTDGEKAAWNGKASTTVATTSANGLMAAADKTKLNGIAAGANNYVHPADANTRHVTDSEKAAWNSKASTAVVTTSANGLMAAGDKSKLDGVAVGANNYVHPATHAISQVSGLQTALDGKVTAEANNGMITQRRDGGITYGIHVSPKSIMFSETDHIMQVMRAPIKISTDWFTLPPTVSMDTPGLLRAGSVNGDGSLINSWGAKECFCVRYNGQVGRYKLTHYIGHTDYFVSPAIVGEFTGTASAIDKQKDFVIISIRGLDAGYYDSPFDFVICGLNT